MELKCEAVLFDLDGVLIDSMACIERHWRRWATKHELDAEKILAVAHGRRTVETIRLIAPRLSVEEEAAELEEASAGDTDGLKKIEGALQLLQSIPKTAWAIATSGNRQTAMTRLNFALLPVPFALITADDVINGKPHPEAYLMAASQLGVEAEKCVVIEDAPAGIQAARAANMQVIAVASTHRRQELEGADAIAEKLSDIQVFSNGEERVQLMVRITSA
jgi:mannitol-1-/sugar-/sorbitol-6-phosphatase